MFCQNENQKGRLSSVMTLKMSEQIIEAAQFHYKLRGRLAGVCDLITAEAKCHLPCLSAFKRNAKKARLETKERDLAMIWLCEGLEYAADKGHVIKLNDAWNRYMVLAEGAEIESAADQHLKTNCCSDLEMRWIVSSLSRKARQNARVCLFLQNSPMLFYQNWLMRGLTPMSC